MEKKKNNNTKIDDNRWPITKLEKFWILIKKIERGVIDVRFIKSNTFKEDEVTGLN